MTKKINIIFDATWIFLQYDGKHAGRSGLFFVAYNLLKEFAKNENISIFLYSSSTELYRKWNGVKKELSHDISCENIFLYNPSFLRLQNRIDYLESQILNGRSNIITKFKLFINHFFRIFFQNKRQDIFLKSVNAFFSPVFKAPDFLDKYSNIEQYVLLHDTTPILFPKYFESCGDDHWFKYLFQSLDKNKKYFSNSEATKKDFLRFNPYLREENVIVTLLACAKNFTPSLNLTQKSLKKYNLPLDKKYIFSLCSLDPRKNLIRAVKAFIEFIKKNNINDFVFILGGGNWGGFEEELDKNIVDLNAYKDKIIKAGYIDDEDLAPLYSSAQWFVYTSQYEGFGLPPLEAMSCGCPVITSNNSSLPEVVGDAGIMIDWDSDEQHIEAYEKYYFDDEYRKEMAQKGLERSKQFSWEKCADIMIEEFTK